jgi:hypothetical protein
MSRLDLARDRLDGALENLEKIAKNLVESGGGAAAGEAAARIAVVEEERDRLLGRIAELEEELAMLSSLTSEVEGRLDGAIGEIRAALARQ